MSRTIVPVCVLFLLSLPAHAQESRLLAVLELQNKLKGKDAEALDASYLSDVVRSEALKVPGLKVMTRENMAVLLGAEGKKLADCEGECEVETGRKLGADLVASGELLRFGSSFKLSLKLHETRSGQLVSGVQAGGADAEALERSLRTEVAALFSAAAAAVSQASTSTATACQIALPVEGCPRNKSFAGTFIDKDLTVQWDQASCLNRANEWAGWCAVEHPVAARFLQGARELASKNSSAHCEISLPEAGCPPHKEYSGTFSDFSDRSHSDPARCLARAADWYAWCREDKPVTSRFFEGAIVVQSKTSATRCEISLPDEGCLQHKEARGTFVDNTDASHESAANCTARGAQWFGWCGATKPVLARFIDGGKVVNSISTTAHCEISLSDEGCRAHPEFHGTFTDTAPMAHGEEARCLRRAAEWYAWCGDSKPAVARWFDGAKWSAAKIGNTRCEIALSDEGCPQHKEQSGTFTDPFDDSQGDPARCSSRAIEWISWCKSTKAVEARFYEGASVTARRTVSP